MNLLISRTLALVATLTFLAATATAPADDAKAIQGTWKAAKAELAGHVLSDGLTREITLTLTGGAYTVTFRDSADKGTYKLDLNTNPRTITIAGTEGPNKDKTFHAIYELDGDTLRICYDLSGEQTPREFKTETGTKLYLVTYERQKP
jgi:uncharacterized protein (TIGR03067 family)